MISKAWIVDLVKAARADFHMFIEDLTPAQRNASATADKWSPKDEIAHNAFTIADFAGDLRAVRDGQPISDALTNEVVWEQRKAWTWAEVLADLDRAFDAVLTQLDRFEFDELTDAGRFTLTTEENQPRRSLLVSVVGRVMLHPYLHFMDMNAKRGDPARSTGFLERMITLMKEAGDTRMHGMAVYNLACVHALSGNATTAIALLNEALRLTPDLKEWSQQDPDLASLRELPEFQTLVTA